MNKILILLAFFSITSFAAEGLPGATVNEGARSARPHHGPHEACKADPAKCQAEV
jgi:hypothetical protein